jgi:hypothetical protein
MKSEQREPASFRDPGGFLFEWDGTLYRQINHTYRQQYDRLMASGLYDVLVRAGHLIAHEEVDVADVAPASAYKIIRPVRVPFISYPYEWTFGQLKEAALLTLHIQKRALDFGMVLKDASAYNIQFVNGHPVLIDTLSFEAFTEGEPWIAYRQFCQHFLAPLALMAYRDVRLGQLLRIHVDGIPLDLAARLLPMRSRLSVSLLIHLHLHARAQQRYAGKPVSRTEVKRRMSRNGLIGIIDSLKGGVQRLRWNPAGTAWGDYYDDSNYTGAALEHKQTIVGQFIDRIEPTTVWDLGANTGLFSQITADRGIFTVALDADPGAAERHYQSCAGGEVTNVLPLVLDLTNPSPGLGWGHEERKSLLSRGPTGAVLALALVHHLAIGNNVPLQQIAAFFSQLSPWLIIEFIPKSDSQVRRLLAMRDDIFPSYTQDGFEQAFSQTYSIRAQVPIDESERILYLMQRRR